MKAVMRQIIMELTPEDNPNMTVEIIVICLMQGNDIIKIVEYYLTEEISLCE